MISHIIRTLPLRTKTSEISSIASVAMLEFRRTFAHSDTHISRLRRYAEKPCRFIPAALFVRAMTYEGVLGRRAIHIFIRGPIIIGSSCIIFTPDFARGAHSISDPYLSQFWSKTALKHDFNSCMTDGPTDRPTHGRTDGRTDGHTLL